MSDPTKGHPYRYGLPRELPACARVVVHHDTPQVQPNIENRLRDLAAIVTTQGEGLRLVWRDDPVTMTIRVAVIGECDNGQRMVLADQKIPIRALYYDAEELARQGQRLLADLHFAIHQHPEISPWPFRRKHGL